MDTEILVLPRGTPGAVKMMVADYRETRPDDSEGFWIVPDDKDVMSVFVDALKEEEGGDPGKIMDIFHAKWN